MINEVIAFNTGYGDCSLLHNKEGVMLVDFGGSKGAINNISANLIKNLNYNDREKNILITHLHKDHYNGVSILKNKVLFKNVYLPDYITGDGFYIIAAALLTNHNRIVEQAKNILSLLGLMFCDGTIDKNTKITFLSRGNTFCNKTGEYKALLPNVYSLNSNLHKIIKDNQNILKFKKKYFSNILKVDQNQKVYKVSENIKKSNDEINSFIDENYTLFSNKQIEIITKEFKKYHNEMSIVFQNLKKCQKNILFCGDALSKEIKLIENDLYEKYELIKIQHHGTYKKYFYDKFPSAKKFLIFNGSGNNCSEISCKYDNMYGANVKFICSNPRCTKIKHNCIFKCNTKIKNKAICGFNLFYNIKI